MPGTEAILNEDRRITRSKIDLPLLRTDPELDLLSFARQLEPDFAHLRFPMVQVEDDEDEGVSWPSWATDCVRELDSALAAEKLQIKRADLLFLQSAVSLGRSPSPMSLSGLDEALVKARRSRLLRSVPLQRARTKVAIIQSSQNEIPQSSPVATGNSFSAAHELEDTCASRSERSWPSTGPQDRNVFDSPILNEGVPEVAATQETVEVPSESISSETLYPGFGDAPPPGIFENSTGTTKARTNRIPHFKVPRLDGWPLRSFSVRSRLSNETTFSSTLDAHWSSMKRFTNERWPVRKSLDRELSWVPFSLELRRISSEEELDDGGGGMYLKSFLKMTESGIDSSAFIWKPEGLKMLRDLYEEEEELLPGLLPHRAQRTVVRKRKRLAPGEEGGEVKSAHGGPFSTGGGLLSFMKARGQDVSLLTSHPPPGHHPPRPVSVNFAPEDSATNLRRHRMFTDPLPYPPIYIPDLPHAVIISTALSTQHSLIRRLEELSPSIEFIERDYTSNSLSASHTLPLPSASLLEEADLTISASTGILLTTLQKLKQRSLHASTGPFSHPPPSARTNAALSSPLKQRIARAQPRYARLIVLVSEGLRTVSTTSYPTMQHNAPEVSPVTGGLKEGDTDALVDLMAFASGRRQMGKVDVLFVGGGEEQLAGWIAGIMSPVQPLSSSLSSTVAEARGERVKLLHEETLWEIFLRKAGLNPYAAQAILSTLKKGSQRAPSLGQETKDLADERFENANEGRRRGEIWTLAAFVTLSFAERVSCFAGGAGGVSASSLRRLEDVFDAAL